ncbi:MAG TPA: CHAD domain-containing protein [Holophagaceae bacterium]|jgi:CHAD domain-containing protein|nr:CHAD domain-containing protein [Holophagaceae bacterium]
MAAPYTAPWKAWSAEQAGVRAGEVEPIHRLRVATGRLGAARELMGAKPSRRLAELREALGQVRIWDMHRALLLELAVPPGDRAEAGWFELLAWIGRCRHRELKALGRRLNGPALRRCAAPPVPEARELEPALARVAGGEENPEILHALRIALRRHRYALEWRDPDSPLLAPLRNLGDALGLHRDWLQLERLLADREHRWLKRGRKGLAAGLRELGFAASLRRKSASAALAPFAEALRAAAGP